MKMNKILIGIMLSSLLIVSVCIFVNDRARAEEQSPELTEISSKLDQILNNEKAIMDQMSSLRQELNIIKIRVTQQQ